MTFPALLEVEGKLKERQDKLAAVFAEAGPEYDMSKVKSLDGDSKAKVDAIRTMNEELDALGVEREGLLAVQKAAERSKAAEEKGKPGPGERGSDGGQPKGRDGAEQKDFGSLFTASQAFKARTGSGGPESSLDIELKTLFQTSAGWAPETTRTGRVVEYATTPLDVLDLIPNTTTQQAAIVYMEETTFTNAAAETAEGGTYPESALALTEKSSPVRKIATWLPMTDEQLEDEPYARSYVNARLPFMVRQRLNTQILTGDGTAPNLRGALNVAGIQTQAKGSDPVPDAAYKAMVKIRTTGQAIPGAFAFNPLDWQDVRLLRTADGIYIWGSPSEAAPARLWGLPVAEAQGLTQNTGLCGDFANFSELAVKRGIDVQVSNSHSTFFVEGKQAVRADIRVALVFYRPTAFCTITGI